MKILTDLPSLKILGDYDAKGRILVLPIEGKGPFEIEASKSKYLLFMWVIFNKNVLVY